MYKIIMNVIKTLAATALLAGITSANAALITVDITGNVISGEEFGDNAFDLFVGDTITATATFDDSALGAGINTVNFGGSNTLSIDVNGTIFTDADDAGAGASLEFTDGLLTNFDFFATSPEDFNSLGMFFDDLGGCCGDLFGEWDANVTVVPVPAAVWLFGSGLLGLVGVARRKTA